MLHSFVFINYMKINKIAGCHKRLTSSCQTYLLPLKIGFSSEPCWQLHLLSVPSDHWYQRVRQNDEMRIIDGLHINSLLLYMCPFLIVSFTWWVIRCKKRKGGCLKQLLKINGNSVYWYCVIHFSITTITTFSYIQYILLITISCIFLDTEYVHFFGFHICDY